MSGQAEKGASLPGSAARAVADYCVAKPYYGRDQQLARGWLVVLDALDSGKNVRAALDAFAVHVVESSNNGVPKQVLRDRFRPPQPSVSAVR